MHPAVLPAPPVPQVQSIFKQFPLACNVTNKLYRGWDTKIVAYRVRAWCDLFMAGFSTGRCKRWAAEVGSVEQMPVCEQVASGAVLWPADTAAYSACLGYATNTPCLGRPPNPPSPQAHLRTSRGAQHIISPDLARAYYGPCAAPPTPCARPRAFNLDTDLFNVTPYYRFKANYLYKGRLQIVNAC